MEKLTLHTIAVLISQIYDHPWPGPIWHIWHGQNIWRTFRGHVEDIYCFWLKLQTKFWKSGIPSFSEPSALCPLNGPRDQSAAVWPILGTMEFTLFGGKPVRYFWEKLQRICGHSSVVMPGISRCMQLPGGWTVVSLCSPELWGDHQTWQDPPADRILQLTRSSSWQTWQPGPACGSRRGHWLRTWGLPCCSSVSQ